MSLTQRYLDNYDAARALSSEAGALPNISTGGHHGDPTGIGIFIVTCLAAGVLIKVMVKQITFVKIPYTVALLVFGFILGALDSTGANLGRLQDSIHFWLNLDPLVLLIMFLPPLLFGDAYVIEWHVFRRLSVQALLLAVPGVLICTILTSLVAVYIFPYGWGWTEGLLFGAMFAATDPVGVIALLNELGAPETLSVLIEGESLLNDGVGFVLFVVFENQLTGRAEYSASEIVGQVLFTSIVGVLIGIAGGLVTLYFIQYIWSDAVLETTVTIVGAFGVFFIGDFLGVSGVLAVVTLGLMFAAQSISYISVEVATVMHEFWHIMEYIANTLVFVFSGVVVAEVLIDGNTLDESDLPGSLITGFDVGMLVLLWVFLNLTRMIMLGVLWIPLKHTGYGFDWKKAMVVSWGGLRGAVGLVAALIVAREKSCNDKAPSLNFPCVDVKTKELMLFFMCGIVLMTLLINGISTKFLVQKLKLNKQSAASRIVFEKAALRMHQHTNTAIESLKRQRNYKGADWDVVWSHMPVLSDEVLVQRTRSEHRSFHKCDAATLRKNLHKITRARFESTECLSDVLLAEARHRFLNLVKSSYRHQFKAGACSSWPALQTLIEASARAQDKDAEPLNEWRDSLQHQCFIPSWYRTCWPKILIRHNIRSLFIARHISRGYDIATSFIEAHLSVENEFQHVANHEIASKVLGESRIMIKEAKMFLRDVESSFDEIARNVKTSVAVQRLLKESAHFAHEMLVNAEIDEKDYAQIESSIEKSLKSIHRRSGFMKIQTAEDLFRQAPFFEGVPPQVVDKCLKNASKRIFVHGDTLLERGDRKSSVFVIVRGKVKVMMKMQDLKNRRPRSSSQSDGSMPSEDDNSRSNRGRPRFWSNESYETVASALSAVSAPSQLEHEMDSDSTSVDTTQGGRSNQHPSIQIPYQHHEDYDPTKLSSINTDYPYATRQSPSNSEPVIANHSFIADLGLGAARKDSDQFAQQKVTRLIHEKSPMIGPLKVAPDSGSSVASMTSSMLFYKSKKNKNKGAPPKSTNGGGGRMIRRSSSAQNLMAVEENNSTMDNSLLRPKSLHAFAINMDTTETVQVNPQNRNTFLRNILHPFEHDTQGEGGNTDDEEDVRNGAKHISGEHKESAESLFSILSRGDTVGEMELIAEMPVVATVMAESIVEAYEIKFDFLHNLFRDAPNSKLERNLLQQAGLLAMESHYPQLRNAPFSLLKWLLHHIEIVHPRAGIPEILGKGKGIILRGKLLMAADRELSDPLVPITVFDIPQKPLTFSGGSVVLWVPKAVCLLAEQSSTHNFRDGHVRAHPHHHGHHHHHHHGHHHGHHHHHHHHGAPFSAHLKSLQEARQKEGALIAMKESFRLPPVDEKSTRKGSFSTMSDATNGWFDDDMDAQSSSSNSSSSDDRMDEIELIEMNRNTSPKSGMSRSLRKSLDEVCISSHSMPSFVLDRLQQEQSGLQPLSSNEDSEVSLQNLSVMIDHSPSTTDIEAPAPARQRPSVHFKEEPDVHQFDGDFDL